MTLTTMHKPSFFHLVYTITAYLNHGFFTVQQDKEI